jgi:hypothetical protein
LPSPISRKTNDFIDEALKAGPAADHPVMVAAKVVRLELLGNCPKSIR